MADSQTVTQAPGAPGGPAAAPGQVSPGGSPGTGIPGAVAQAAGGAQVAAAGASAPSPAQTQAATPGRTAGEEVNPWDALEEKTAELEVERKRRSGMQPVVQQAQERDKWLTEQFGPNWFEALRATTAARQAGAQAPGQTQQPPGMAVTAQQEVQRTVGDVRAGVPISQERQSFVLELAARQFNAESRVDGNPVTASDREYIAQMWEPLLLASGVRPEQLPWRPLYQAQQAQPPTTPEAQQREETPDELADRVRREVRADRQFTRELTVLKTKHLGPDWFAQEIEYRGERMSREEALQEYATLQEALGNPVRPAKALQDLFGGDVIARAIEVGEQRGFTRGTSSSVGLPGGVQAPIAQSPEYRRAKAQALQALGFDPQEVASEPPPTAAKRVYAPAGGGVMP